MVPFRDWRFDPAWLPRLFRQPVRHQDLRTTQLARPAGPGVGEGWLHIKNDSVRRDLMWELNGLDERLERGRGPLDIDLQYRMEAAGIEAWWEPAASVCYLDPHVLDPALPFGGTRPVRLEGRWSWPDGLTYVARRKQEMSEGATFKALNPWQMEYLAELLAPWRDHVEPESRHLDDLTYWGREIWPDTP